MLPSIHHEAGKRFCYRCKEQLSLSQKMRVSSISFKVSKKSRLQQHVVLAASSNPVKVVQRELEFQSYKIPDDIREPVEAAVEKLGGRVTVGDVAATAGVPLADTERALKALAYDTLGTLEVSSAGDVVYVLPADVRAVLRRRSVLMRARPLLGALAAAGGWALRAGFTAALISSLVVVFVGITALMSSGSSDKNDNRSSDSGMFQRRGYFNFTDLFLYSNPSFRRVSDDDDDDDSMSFVDSVFSLVFGDGDPNANFEEIRWKALGQYIQSKGGVVTAEQMAPFLDPPEPASSGMPYPDESFVLPALIRFEGEPLVEPSTGHLLYHFPALQRSTNSSLRTRLQRSKAMGKREAPPMLVLEKPWGLTKASGLPAFGAVMLGTLNVVGVMLLSTMLVHPAATTALQMHNLAWLPAVVPALQAYAASWVVIPLARAFTNFFRNTAIESRNSNREDAAELLISGGVPAAKLESARQLAEVQVVSTQDTVYSTAHDVSEQMAVPDLDDWDTRFAKKRSIKSTWQG